MFHQSFRQFIALLLLITFFLIASYVLIRKHDQSAQMSGPQDQNNQQKWMINRCRHKEKRSNNELEQDQLRTTSFDNFFNETLWPEFSHKRSKSKSQIPPNTSELAHYYVYNKKCKVPRPNPFSNEVMRSFYKPKLLNCSNEDDLISVHFNNHLKQYQLQVNKEALEKITHHKGNRNFSCYYNEIFRSTGPYADQRSRQGTKVYFSQDIFIPRTVQSLTVVCFNETSQIQEDAFAFVQIPDVPSKTQHKTEEMTSRKPSVIMLGLDTMSRMNLRRSMPLTTAYFNKTGWFEMEGYNKVGDNTYPNLLAVLTGYTDTDAEKICQTDVRGCMDELPFVWKFFKKSGYQTAYAEDLSIINTFNFHKPGFLQPPVDYYMRPFLVFIEDMLDYVIHFGYKFCVGRRSMITYVLDYSVRFIDRFITVGRMPVFGLFWSSSITHEHNFGAASFDDRFRDYLNRLKKLRLFEQAIVVFFSDHGSRTGILRESSQGDLEERLPMLFIWLPEWFREKYPLFEIALRQNRNHLTSPFDLHMTLKHILELGESEFKPSLAYSCRSCQSLFRPLPNNRGCSQAGIPKHFCTCDSYVTIASDYYVEYLAQKIVAEINTYVISNGLITKCEFLEFRRLLQTKQKWTSRKSNISSYRLQFETLPRVGKFEATISVNRSINRIEHLAVTHISRLDSYHNDSLCIKHKIAKKFCFCYDRP